MKDSTTFLNELIEAWRANNRINVFLIDKISDEGMACSLSTRGGKSVARQFTHMHNVRFWQLESRAKDLSKGLYKFGPKEEPSKEKLKEALNESAARIEEYFTRVLTGEGKARSFKRGIFTTLAYFVSHESHHRGSILLTLKQSGHKLDQKTSYAIWDWDKV